MNTLRSLSLALILRATPLCALSCAPAPPPACESDPAAVDGAPARERAGSGEAASTSASEPAEPRGLIRAARDPFSRADGADLKERASERARELPPPAPQPRVPRPAGTGLAITAPPSSPGGASDNEAAAARHEGDHESATARVASACEIGRFDDLPEAAARLDRCNGHLMSVDRGPSGAPAASSPEPARLIEGPAALLVPFEFEEPDPGGALSALTASEDPLFPIHD
jgi:hypothetical protein